MFMLCLKREQSENLKSQNILQCIIKEQHTKKKENYNEEIQRENAGIHVFVIKFAGTADITTKYTYFVQVIFCRMPVSFL